MFNYHQPNIENMQQYLNQENEKSSGSSINWWSFPSGMSSIRILPPWDPTGRVALPVYMHPIEFQGEGMSYKKYNWTCNSKTSNKPCQICEGLKALADAGVDVANWEANRRQFYFNAIVMHDPSYNEQKRTGTAPGTHVLLKAPKTFYDWVIAQITNPMIGDITSVTNGIDVYVTKEGSGLGTSYNMTLSPNGRTAVPQEYLDKITDLYNLDEIFSSGFDQEQINDMVNHLKKSAGVMSNSIPNMQQQMAGYTQAPPSMPQPQYNQFAQQAPQMPTQFATNPVPGSATQVTPPWQTPTTNPYVAATGNFSAAGNSTPVMNNTEQKEAPANQNLPKCYGQYDAGSVNCVVCPVEITCSKNS